MCPDILLADTADSCEHVLFLHHGRLERSSGIGPDIDFTDAADSCEYVLFPQNERVRFLAAVGVSKTLKGVGLLEKADVIFKDSESVLNHGGCGSRGKPNAYGALLEARQVIKK